MWLERGDLVSPGSQKARSPCLPDPCGLLIMHPSALVLYSLALLRETVANPTPSLTSVPAFSRAILDRVLSGVLLLERACRAQLLLPDGVLAGSFHLSLLFPDMCVRRGT